MRKKPIVLEVPQVVEYYPGPFSQGIKKVEGCLCTDGKQRTATATGTADTMFSTPARVQVKGTTVSGFISSDSQRRDGKEETIWKFHATGKNRSVLPSVRARHWLTFTLIKALDDCWMDPATRSERPEVYAFRKRLLERLWDRGIDTHYFNDDAAAPEYHWSTAKEAAKRWYPAIKRRFGVEPYNAETHPDHFVTL